MSFFDSDIVKNEIKAVMELQQEIYLASANYLLLSQDDKIHHIELMQKLLDKQRILHARIKLSDDPEANQMLAKMRATASALGIDDKVSFEELFDNMDRIIKSMKKQVEIS